MSDQVFSWYQNLSACMKSLDSTWRQSEASSTSFCILKFKMQKFGSRKANWNLDLAWNIRRILNIHHLWNNCVSERKEVLTSFQPHQAYIWRVGCRSHPLQWPEIPHSAAVKLTKVDQSNSWRPQLLFVSATDAFVCVHLVTRVCPTCGLNCSHSLTLKQRTVAKQNRGGR